jgi:fructose-bisphosphate aldolase class II
MLVTNKEILSTAKAEGYAVGEASVEERSPAIVAVTPSAIKYAGLKYLVEMVKTATESASVPMSLHLDHGDKVETVSKCIGASFTSVMIDDSHLNFEENISLTKRVVDLAHPRGVSVEAELGRLTGVEESTVKEKEAILTDPNAAKEFVERTDVDALAVAIGTSHGAYKFKAEPKLDFERLKAIGKRIKVPLVLHGASGVPSWIVEKATKYGAELGAAKGIPDEHIKKAISLGIAKINIDTDLRLAFTAAIREVLANSPKEFDPRKILGSAKEAIKEVVKGKMRIFGSSGKAS